MPSRGLAELVLIVADLERAAAFYKNAVGLAVERELEGWCWLWAGAPDAKQRIALHKGSLLFEEHSPRPPEARWGPVHFALHVARDELEAAVKRVRDHGTEVHGPVQLDWMQARSYYFYDPDGNLLEFWSPEPE